jgi:hypothetical protein
MTTPAPSPEPPPAEKKRSLLGFYIAMGVMAALFVAGYFAWTPLRVLYMERQVMQASSFPGIGGLGVKTARQEKAEELARLGPVTYHAFARLLKAEHPGDQMVVLHALAETKSTWALPLFAEYIQSPGRKPLFAAVAAGDTETMVGKQFMLHKSTGTDNQLYKETRRRFLVWWEREGKAKYGNAR